jgi:hypothetical protein
MLIHSVIPISWRVHLAIKRTKCILDYFCMNCCLSTYYTHTKYLAHPILKADCNNEWGEQNFVLIRIITILLVDKVGDLPSAFSTQTDSTSLCIPVLATLKYIKLTTWSTNTSSLLIFKCVHFKRHLVWSTKWSRCQFRVLVVAKKKLQTLLV